MISKNNRLIGAILLVSGTTIGAGMLALPMTTGLAGFLPALGVMMLVWLLMIMTALYLLEVNLRLKGEPNLISMVHKTLGRWGEVVAWICYLLLLYALIASYMVGASQLFCGFFCHFLPFKVATWLWPILIFLIFGGFIFLGTEMADFFNRIFMVGLVIAYCIMLAPGIQQVDFSRLNYFDWKYLFPSLSVVSTTFGYHIIIPTLTTYLEHDVKLVKKAILIGSFIPFVVYVIWLMIVAGIVPVVGPTSLLQASAQKEQITIYMSKIVQSPIFLFTSQIFSFFAIVTSLLGVGLSLTDFLADGLKVKKSKRGKMAMVLLAFLPPLGFAIFYPHGFILALGYAGIFVMILLAVFPPLMAFFERKKAYAKDLWPLRYQVFGGKPMLFLTLIVAIVLLVIQIGVR